jgi:F0F1-type ATP synthase membrane subunit b/b'
VPADRALEQTTELEPVLALLTATEQDCREIVEAARREAAEIRTRCADEARSTLADAHSRQAAERAAAAAQVQHGGRALTTSAALAAQQREIDVRQHAALMMPDCVEQVVDAVRTTIGEDVPTGERLAGAP